MAAVLVSVSEVWRLAAAGGDRDPDGSPVWSSREVATLGMLGGGQESRDGRHESGGKGPRGGEVKLVAAVVRSRRGGRRAGEQQQAAVYKGCGGSRPRAASSPGEEGRRRSCWGTREHHGGCSLRSAAGFDALRASSRWPHPIGLAGA